MINQAENPTRARFAEECAIGYIDTLADERLISLDGGELMPG